MPPRWVAFYILYLPIAYICKSVRQYIAILLFFCISCQMVARMGVIAWYEVNKSYVAKELCQNRNMPEKKCAGKCYLKKQLHKIDNEENKGQKIPVKKHNTELPEFVVLNIPLQFHLFQDNNSISQYAVYINNYIYKVTSAIFHPPQSC